MTHFHPKRLTPPAPVGSLLKRDGDSPQPCALKAEKKDDPTHLALVRRLPCLYCGLEPSEAAHVKFSDARSGHFNKLGRRPRDSETVPLCAEDHRLARHAQHQGNERAFWEALGIDPYCVAQRLSQKSGDYPAMLMVVQVAIAERTKVPRG